jgi:putative ABC transport system permease protein
MDALDRKLLRDFRRLWAQAVAIALVLACGVAILMTTFGMSRALEDTRTAYYDRYRFADVFATASRAPRTLLPEILAIPGVLSAEARVSQLAVLDIPGRVQTGIGQILSLPAEGLPELNRPILRAGLLPDPDADDEILVNEPFARANGFVPGDAIHANLNGRLRELRITGTFLSPEFIYTLPPGGMMPDNEGFAVIYMPERAAAAAFDLTGAFSSLSLMLSADAREAEVIARLDALLEPYGGAGAHGRDEQMSHAFIDAELKQLRALSLILPPIFFAISAFLVNMVIGRIVLLERSEIGLLKAIGYSSWAVALHYQMLAGLVALVGIVTGWVAGYWLTYALAWQYARFFEFPFLIYSLSWVAFATSGLLGLATAALGAMQSALRAARLAPAVAMLPPAPPSFRRGIFDRLLHALRLSQPAMMILRSLVRWPVRTALSALGMSFAVAILVASNFFEDSLAEILDAAFVQSMRQDSILLFSSDQPVQVLEEVRRLPGILAAEGQQSASARLRHGHAEKRFAIEARPPGADLWRVIGADGRPVEVPPGAIVLSETLAGHLHARAGDTVEVEVHDRPGEVFLLPVAGTVRLYFGLGAYVDHTTFAAMMRQAPRYSFASVLVDPGETAALHAAIKALPGLAGEIALTETRRSFQETIDQNISVMAAIYIVIAVLITVGVAYNGARIQLSERARELASLRILGFTRAEVSFVLVGETMLVALIAQPLGWLIGAGIARASISGFDSDLYRIPLVLKPATFATASLVVLAAALGAALVVRRRIDRLDLVAVMKTRE